MYDEYIKQLNPKPSFNLKWYRGTDDYSDGDIEDSIIKIIAENEPEDYRQAMLDNVSWPVYYHLTHVRKNILNWYPFKTNASVLEIGCGMGAITGTLCQKCEKVTAVELSKRRATATLLRCREYENLEIIVGNLNDIEFPEKYDYITLIGVLEYQGRYTDTGNPYVDFLKKIRTLLKPGGVLLVAIENQYGLKYWCGAKEDHTGIPFDGINQYILSNNSGVRTFSREGLRNLIYMSGFESAFFYYPMPDYKLPSSIFSEKYMPDTQSMRKILPYYAPNPDSVVAQEKIIYDDIIENGAFEFFANSFLVECSDSRKTDIDFVSLQETRQPEYRIGTLVTSEKVMKISLNGQAYGHLDDIKNNELYLMKHGLNVLLSKDVDDHIETPFLNSPILQDVLVGCLQQGDIDMFIGLIDDVWSEILKSSDRVDWEENILYSFDIGIHKDRERFGEILELGSIDMTFSNVLCESGGFKWFDQEWGIDNVPAKFILFRAIDLFFDTYPSLETVISSKMVMDKYGISDCEKEFRVLDNMFLRSAMDFEYIEYTKNFRLQDGNILARNINMLLS